MQNLVQLSDASYFNREDFSLKAPLNKVNVVMLFYRDGCPHCDDYKPHFIEAAMNDDSAVYIMVDTARSPQIMKMLSSPNAPFQIQGVPSIVSFNKGKFYSKFGGQRNAQNTVMFARTIGKAQRMYNPRI